MYDIYDNHCPHCEVGRWRLIYTTYLQLLDGKILTVSDLPIYVCDVCGNQEYDSEALLDIQLLTGQLEADVEDGTRHPRRASNIELKDSSNTSQSKKP